MLQKFEQRIGGHEFIREIGRSVAEWSMTSAGNCMKDSTEIDVVIQL